MARLAYRNLVNKLLFNVLKFVIPKNDLRFFFNWTKFQNETRSASQLGQEFLPFFFGLNSGYFCEVGANDGLRFSNTLYLESIGWDGLLIEPDPRNMKSLEETRHVNILHFAATNVDDYSLTLNLAPDTLFSGNLNSMNNATLPYNGFVLVKGFKLASMLESVKAPSAIDLLTIDTEGNEFDVLLGMDFKKYQVRIVCVEHNYNLEKLSKIKSYLDPLGFAQILPVASQFDAWFINIETWNNYD